MLSILFLVFANKKIIMNCG